MSDTSQGPGWWLASDGRWYPPEAWTGPPAQTVQAPSQLPAPYQPGPYPYPAAQSPYQPGQGPPWVPAPQTSGLAVASLACSCAGVIPILFGVPCILGIIFGFVSRSRIKRSQGALGGSGLALAGIIVGFSLIGIFVILVILLAAFGHSCVDNGGQTTCG